MRCIPRGMGRSVDRGVDRPAIFFIHGLWSGSPPDTRGRSPVRKSRTPGSVRGVSGNGYPYRDI
ncbi:hypothetical protein AOG30_10265 [Klebsiella pneumoniae subsp. pneumoniae]|nr:hypothetical protein AOG30_10265 [Klebsiella pneumoniae subsp. pneumoniae]